MNQSLKYGIPWQVYDAVKKVDDGCGAIISIEQANPLLAPYNMVLREVRPRYILSVLDEDKPWPSDWSRVADEIVLCGERQPTARIGRKRWPLLETKIDGSSMSTFIERLVAEEQELDQKLEKLHVFIEDSPMYAALVPIDQRLLVDQRAAMTVYRDILRKRIARV